MTTFILSLVICMLSLWIMLDVPIKDNTAFVVEQVAINIDGDERFVYTIDSPMTGKDFDLRSNIVYLVGDTLVLVPKNRRNNEKTH